MVVYGSMDRLFRRNVDLTTFESTTVIRIFTLIQAANALIEALPRLHGNVDDMARHRERFDNFFRMCTHLFTEVFYKFDLFRAFIEEVRTETNRAIEFDASFGTSTIREVFNRGIDSLREHLNWDTIKDYITIPYIPSDYECLHLSHDIYNENNWPFGPIDDLIDDFQTRIINRTYTQLDLETNDDLPHQFEAFRTSLRRILLTIYDEELGTANPYAHDTDSVSIAYGTDEGDINESTSNHRVHIDMDELSLF
jgi:hypothetical protein